MSAGKKVSAKGLSRVKRVGAVCLALGVFCVIRYLIIPFYHFSSKEQVVRYGFFDPLGEFLAIPLTYFGVIFFFLTRPFCDLAIRMKSKVTKKYVEREINEFRLGIGNLILMIPAFILGFGTFYEFYQYRESIGYVYCLDHYSLKCEYMDAIKSGSSYDKIMSAMERDKKRMLDY